MPGGLGTAIKEAGLELSDGAAPAAAGISRRGPPLSVPRLALGAFLTPEAAPPRLSGGTTAPGTDGGDIVNLGSPAAWVCGGGGGGGDPLSEVSATDLEEDDYWDRNCQPLPEQDAAAAAAAPADAGMPGPGPCAATPGTACSCVAAALPPQPLLHPPDCFAGEGSFTFATSSLEGTPHAMVQHAIGFAMPPPSGSISADMPPPHSHAAIVAFVSDAWSQASTPTAAALAALGQLFVNQKTGEIVKR